MVAYKCMNRSWRYELNSLQEGCMASKLHAHNHALKVMRYVHTDATQVYIVHAWDSYIWHVQDIINMH